MSKPSSHRLRRKPRASLRESKFSPPSRTLMLSAGQFTSPSLRTTLRWGFRGVTAASASYGEGVFSGNNLFDPGLASASTQPVGFDQYALWYTQYKVLASRLTIRSALASTSATPTATALAGSLIVYPSISSSPAASTSEAEAQPYVQVRKITEAKPATVVSHIDLSKIYGLKTAGYDATLATTSSGSPTFPFYWHVGTVSGGYTSVETQIDVTLDYDVEFCGRQQLALSSLEQGLRYTRMLQDKEREVAAQRPCHVFKGLDARDEKFDTPEVKSEDCKVLKISEPSTPAAINSEKRIILSQKDSFAWVKVPAASLK